jgi:hypothetical protein
LQVDRDIPCVTCKYNLRGLEDAGICPECGAAVAQSLTPKPRFRHAYPHAFKYGLIGGMCHIAGSLLLLLIGLVMGPSCSGGQMLVLLFSLLNIPIFLVAKHLNVTGFPAGLIYACAVLLCPAIYIVLGGTLGYIRDLVRL